MNYQELPKLPTDLPKLPTQLPELPKLPQLPKLDTLADKPEQTPATPPPSPETPEETKHSVDNFGWLKNLPESTVKYVKSIVFDLPKATIESAVHYARDPKQYTKDLALVFQKNNGLGTFFKEQMVDYYTKDFWKNFNEDPAHALGDVAALASLGGGLIAKAGEVGGLARTAKVGAAIANTGNYLDPLTWVGKGAAKVAAPALEAIGVGKYTPEWIAGRAHLRAKRALESAQEMQKVVFSNLSPADNAALERLIRWGDAKELDAAIKLADEGNIVGKRLKLWRELITAGDEPLFKELNLLNDDMAVKANIESMVEYSRNHYKELGFERPITHAEARDMILPKTGTPTHVPTYMSTYRLKSQAPDLFEALNKPAYRGGTWSRFERRAANNAPSIVDMDTVQARQIASKHDALYKLDLMDFTKALMAEKGESIFIAKAGDAINVPKTHAPLQEAFHKKYWLDMIKGGEVNVKYLSSVDNPMEGLAMAKAALEENPEILKAIQANGDIYVPKHVAALLNRELAPISNVGRMYDNMMGHFKGLATVWNPRFWGSVVFGNSMLGLLYGISPDVARIAYKYKGDLPPELRALTRHEIYLRDKGIYSRVSNSLGEAAQYLDNLFRLPIFASEIAKEMHARTFATARDFFLSSDELAKAIKHYGQAPEKLMSARLRISKLERDIAVRSPEVAKLERDLATMAPAATQAARLKQARYAPHDPEWVKAMDTLDRAGNLEEHLKTLKADQVHRLAELGELQKSIPSLRLDAAVADRAIEVGNRFYGSYARLSPFERTVLRRILPFYTFNKAMTMLAFRFPYLYPKRAFVGAHLAQAWFDITSDENSYMPVRLKNYVPVAALQDGSVVAVSAGYLNPMAGVRVGSIGEAPIPSVYNPLTAHPVIQLLVKMNGGIPEWSSKPLSPGAYATRLDNGVVIQWTGSGFKTTIAQPSIFKSIADLFPQAQLIDKLLHPYAQSDRGWLFNPDPILGPDGKPRYPKELVDIILSNVIPTQTYNLEEVKNVERAKMAAVIKSYVRDLRYASPVRRQQIMDVLNGWQEEKNRRWVQ